MKTHSNNNGTTYYSRLSESGQIEYSFDQSFTDVWSFQDEYTMRLTEAGWFHPSRLPEVASLDGIYDLIEEVRAYLPCHTVEAAEAAQATINALYALAADWKVGS